MNEGEDKIWNRPWSTEQFIKNAENWSLAGDVALLNTIKSFAKNLLTKTDDLNNNVNDLLNNLDEVGLKLDITQNEFQNLKNTQFIESRVYDDDEALDSKENEKVTDHQIPEKLEEKDFNASLSSEIKLLDKYYEMVEISISDSEDESERSFVLKPKDIYEERQLPPLIGSDEWYKNWYIDDQVSDVDSQKSSEVYSESDSDDNLPKDLFNGSECSSELDFSHQANETKPVANSTFKDNTRKQKSRTSSDESEDLNSLPVKAPISNKNFAEQLAARLDSVISKEENVSTEINTKPIQPKTEPFSAGLFSNEPPPLSDSEDKTMKGIFSEGKNLFDDDDEDDLVFNNSQKRESLSQIKKEKIMNVDDELSKSYVERKDDMLSKSSQISKGLFDSDNSDDDLFAPKTQNINKQMFLQSNKPLVPLFDEEPPSLHNEKKIEKPVKKKPTGGVSIFGNKDIGDILKTRHQNSRDENIENPPTNRNKEMYKQEDIKQTQKINLFDDDDDDDLFKKNYNQPKTKKLDLFDDTTERIDAENNNKIIIDKNSNINKEKITNVSVAAKKSKVISLFDDDDLSNDDDDIFSSVKNPIHFNNTSKISIGTRHLDLFMDDEDDINENQKSEIDKNKNIGLFDDDIDKIKKDHDTRYSKTYNLIIEKGTNNNNIAIDSNNDKSTSENSKEPVPFNKNDSLKEENKYKIINDNLIGEKMPSSENVDLFGNISADNNVAEKETLEEKKRVFLFDNDNSSNLFENHYKETVSSEKPKIISLFGDDNDEDEDIFSNVTKNINFKLFEDPESTKDLFSFKKTVGIEDNRIEVKNAEIKKTSDVIQKEENVKQVDNVYDVEHVSVNNAKTGEDQKSEPNLLEKIKTELNPEPIKIVEDNTDTNKNKGEEDIPKSNLLFDYELPKNNETFNNVENSNSFMDKKDKTPPKPELAVKPNLTSIATTITQSFDTVTPPDVVQTVKQAMPPILPVISLFGSSPPPDDDNWDTKSDNFSDPEDFVSFREEENSYRSSLFDNEPPSLNGYESSGIVRDQSNTRIDTDESSFYPYASSSRRFSSDIFSDQQSQDSFFVTKNKTESSTSHSQLDIIPEDSKMSTIGVTPSGNLEASIESTLPEVTSNKNNSALSDSVFLNTPSLDSLLDMGNNKNGISEVKKHDKKENDKVEVNERKAKVEKSLNKIASITERLKNQSPIKTSEKNVSPGKLKPTLNINVNALLPGLSQPKIKTLTKPQPKKENSDTENSTSDINTSTIKTDDLRDVSQSPVDIDQTVGFDVTDNVNILPSITKERVRNPARRRPSTRKGRQEALRTSIVVDNDTVVSGPQTETSSDILNVHQQNENCISDNKKETVIENEQSNEYSNMPHLPSVTKTELGKKILSRNATAKNNIFDSESESDKEIDLFGSSNQNKSKTDNSKLIIVTPESKDALFNELPRQMTEDDLFKSAKESTEDSDSKENIFENKKRSKFESLKKDKVKPKIVPKKSLFADSSSDDDLFLGSNKGTNRSETNTKPIEKKIRPKVKKLENVETEQDPLSNLLK